MRHRINHRWARGVLLAGCVLLVGAACDPLVNAPPGGGQTITQTFRYGPFTLGPGQEVEGFPQSGMPRPTGAFGLKSARFDVVEQVGQNFVPVSVHDVHLHHIVMTTSRRQDRLCSNWPERFIASGMERTPMTLAHPYAYMVQANDTWGSVYHLMNQTPPGTPAKTVYIEYTLGYQPGANATNSRLVDVYFQDVTGCGTSTYQVPGTGGPGSEHLKSRSWPITQDGLVISTGGHVHMGGIGIRLEASGGVVCYSHAKYHQNPDHLDTINGCRTHYRVSPGQNFNVIAQYDNSQPWVDVMGIMLSYVWWGTQ